MTPVSLPFGSPCPPSATVTMAATRRRFLKGSLLGAAALGSPSLLAACGGDDSGGGGSGGGGGSVKFGINEASGSGPAYDRLKAMADAYTKTSGIKVELNAVDHNTFQENINTYLQGSPDDVFTWFAGYRMQPVRRARADHRRQRRVAHRRDQRRLQEASDRRRRQAVLRAGRLLPLGGLLPQVGLREERLHRRPRRSTS